VRIAVVAGQDGTGLLSPLGDDGSEAGPAERAGDLPGAIAARERSEGPRWVFGSAAEIYPALLRAGVRVARCHDVRLAEALLLAYDGRFGEPASMQAAWARLRGLPVPPPGSTAGPRAGGGTGQDELFSLASTAGGAEPDDDERLRALIAVHADQLSRTARAEHPQRLTLLTAAESAGALAAAEMTADGIPWRADVHDAVLTELLGPRPTGGLRPPRLARLAGEISAAFGGRPVNPDSPAQLARAFAADGVRVPSTRSHVLEGLEHPAAALLLEYKELARLNAAHGWAWLDEWVSGGRFRPEYVPGGVVSGRWATRGGGALQIPRVLRRAVVADPGWALVAGDAAQLEPRVLAALAGDRAFAGAAAAGDLYSALAGTFGSRDKVKTALLSAMYGGAGGEASALLGVLRRRFPDAARYVEAAARAGEEGRLVRSRLGRTCPPASPRWRELTADGADPAARAALRSRGRFTRNFVVQASAADWALVLLAALRRRLAALPPAAGRTGPGHLVFFQHDEVVVHCAADQAAAVAEQISAAGDEAARLVFGPTQVRFPLTIAAVDCYADAKPAVIPAGPAPDAADVRSRPNKIVPIDPPSDVI
jgi:DNA polymerase family A